MNRVTKEHAINLKKLGYDLPTNAYYHETSNNVDDVSDYGSWIEYHTIYSAPTISDAIQWMWDKFGINISVEPVSKTEWIATIRENEYGCFVKHGDTRPAAQSAGLDAAISYKLKQIENENRSNK